MRKNQVSSNEYGAFYQSYFELTGAGTIVFELEQSRDKIYSLFASLTAEEWEHRYAVGKWSLKEMMMHLIETERVFAFRAFWISRDPATPLPGFDQDTFVTHSNVEARTTASLLSEYEGVRAETTRLFTSFSQDQLQQLGQASGAPLSVRAAGYLISGHELSHLKVIHERYL
ncbi:DinB family protein [Altibacter sp. HG106]|uniref:DinB family protein n=1 Tax=Altibacter sp. HG106 TaxID=3023937 RepID=UPI0023509A34|nr:DinB family protein [Altibacter sp. HG106]MDC7993619.1 DinB family protein [Altibacter sp. HG106]